MNEKYDKLTAPELHASQQQIQFREILKKFNKNGNQSIENILFGQAKISKADYCQRLSYFSKTKSPLQENSDGNGFPKLEMPPFTQPPLGEL